MNNITRSILWTIGLTAGGILAVRGCSNYGTSDKVQPLPLREVVAEAEQFDVNPRDQVLSALESEEFIRAISDRDRSGTISPEEIRDTRRTINRLLNDGHKNTEETARNLERALDFILLRQSINDSETKPTQLREEELDYSDFIRVALQEDKPLVKKIIITNNSDTIRAVFLDDSVNEVRIPYDVTAIKELADALAEKSIQVEVKPAKSNLPGSLLFSLLPIGLLLLFFYVMARKNMQGVGGSLLGGLNIKRSSAYAKPNVTFDDVAGIDEAKVELQEVVDFLKDPRKYKALGAKLPKGVLLVGEPGTGKTLCAKAIAGEAKANFLSVSGSDFVEMFVGRGAARVRELFNKAKEAAPCVVFIDEIDAVGRSRGAGFSGGHDEREQTLNQLLVGMDGFENSSLAEAGIVILAATNRPDVLDNALLRPGRFDRQIVIDKPDINGREAILKVHAKGKPLASEVDLKIVAQRTPGFTGADLENILNEAAIFAAREEKNEISMDHLERAYFLQE